ncbi:MAG: hypothetical protein OXD00_00250, partial [Gammaproteobacteria bacterium]|nr:hypothetical protein [Gammaproteobacteria bacterium]
LAICPIFPADCALPSAIVLTLNHTYLWDRALAVAHAFGCRSGLDLEEGYRAAGIEIKSSSVWREQYNRGLNTLLDAGEIQQAFGIYTGERAQRFGRVRVLPYKEALRLAWGGGLIDG